MEDDVRRRRFGRQRAVDPEELVVDALRRLEPQEVTALVLEAQGSRTGRSPSARTGGTRRSPVE